MRSWIQSPHFFVSKGSQSCRDVIWGWGYHIFICLPYFVPEIIEKYSLFFVNFSLKTITKRQTDIASEVAIRALEACGVPYVRIMEHGIKNPYFSLYLENLEIVHHDSNWFDFGLN